MSDPQALKESWTDAEAKLALQDLGLGLAFSLASTAWGQVFGCPVYLFFVSALSSLATSDGRCDVWDSILRLDRQPQAKKRLLLMFRDMLTRGRREYFQLQSRTLHFFLDLIRVLERSFDCSSDMPGNTGIRRGRLIGIHDPSNGESNGKEHGK